MTGNEHAASDEPTAPGPHFWRSRRGAAIAGIAFAVALVLLVASGEGQWTPLLFFAWVLLLSVTLLFRRPGRRGSRNSR